MKHCDACTVDFTGDMARCPLCQNELRGEASPAAFPAQQIYLRPRRLAVEIITFVTGAILLLHGFFDTDCQCIGSRADHQRAVHQ